MEKILRIVFVSSSFSDRLDNDDPGVCSIARSGTYFVDRRARYRPGKIVSRFSGLSYQDEKYFLVIFARERNVHVRLYLSLQTVTPCWASNCLRWCRLGDSSSWSIVREPSNDFELFKLLRAFRQLFVEISRDFDDLSDAFANFLIVSEIGHFMKSTFSRSLNFWLLFGASSVSCCCCCCCWSSFGLFSIRDLSKRSSLMIGGFFSGASVTWSIATSYFSRDESLVSSWLRRDFGGAST